jgi:hypothetical protein
MDIFNEADVPLSPTWKHWTSVTGGRVHTKEQQWTSSDGGVVQYKFWYFSPDLNDLVVEAAHCSSDQLQHTRHHVDCSKAGPIPIDDPSFSASVLISRIELIEKGYRIYFRIENTGSKAFLLSVDGTLEGGFPHLRAGPQQSENGEWTSVSGECFEFPPMTWMAVEPGAKVESWTSAIDFPGPNHRFGMCTRKAGHLHGPLRVALRYYTGLCDIQDGLLAKKPYIVASQPAQPPSGNP